jgi:hypothetical protein
MAGGIADHLENISLKVIFGIRSYPSGNVTESFSSIRVAGFCA